MIFSSYLHLFSPNSNEKNSLIDTRSPIEIVISELEAVACGSRKQVGSLVAKLSRRLENSKRKRFNSEVSDLSATRYVLRRFLNLYKLKELKLNNFGKNFIYIFNLSSNII